MRGYDVGAFLFLAPLALRRPRLRNAFLVSLLSLAVGVWAWAWEKRR